MDPVGLYGLGLGIGVGLVVIGAAYGIGQLARSALESTGRQPEAAGDIQTQMVIAAALIEGFTFAAIGVVAYGILVTSNIGGTSAAGGAETHSQLDQPGVERTLQDVG